MTGHGSVNEAFTLAATTASLSTREFLNHGTRPKKSRPSCAASEAWTNEADQLYARRGTATALAMTDSLKVVNVSLRNGRRGHPEPGSNTADSHMAKLINRLRNSWVGMKRATEPVGVRSAGRADRGHLRGSGLGARRHRQHVLQQHQRGLLGVAPFADGVSVPKCDLVELPLRLRFFVVWVFRSF